MTESYGPCTETYPLVYSARSGIEQKADWILVSATPGTRITSLVERRDQIKMTYKT